MEVQSQLKHVTEGMEVYDVNDNRIGSVYLVYFGNKMVAGDVPDISPRKVDMRFALGGKSFAPPVMARLFNYGFIRVARGFFKPDAFLLPQQISKVDGNNVHLTVTLNEVLKG